MNEKQMKILVLGLGNELLSDDGAGLIAIRKLKEEYDGQAELVECNLAGLALLDYFLGFDKAIVLDAIHTKRQPPGTIYQYRPEDLGEVYAPSPHYSGLPEMMALASQLELDFPRDIKIFALEVADPYTIGGSLTEPVRNALRALINMVKNQLEVWEKAA
jgi:hydrogenase maturation protease